MSDEQPTEPSVWMSIAAVLLAILFVPLVLGWIFLGGGNLKLED